MVPSPRRLAAVVGCVVGLPAATAAQPGGAGLGAVVRQLVVESLNGGGRRADQVLVAADSGSVALLSLAGIAAATRPAGLVCPGSTEADARPTSTPVGYVVRVTLAAAVDTAAREVQVSKRCEFRYRGRGRGFRETGTWELRRRGGSWYVARMLESSIT